MSDEIKLTYRGCPVRCGAFQGNDGRFTPTVTVAMPALATASTRYLAEFQMRTEASPSRSKEHSLYVGARSYGSLAAAQDAGVNAAMEWLDTQLGALQRHGKYVAFEIQTEQADRQWVGRARIHISSSPLTILDRVSELLSVDGAFESEEQARDAALAHAVKVVDLYCGGGAMPESLWMLGPLITTTETAADDEKRQNPK